MSRTPADWLLLMLGLRVEDGAPELDPVRIQKTLFLLAARGLVPETERYPFDPYHYCPYSFDRREDLDRLVAERLVAEEAVSGRNWSRFRLTPRGFREARARFEGADRALVEQLASIKQRVSTLSFSDLLNEVYDEHPAYATRSVFRR